MGGVVIDAKDMSAGELLKQANRLKREGKLDEAIALYYQVIDINPQFAWVYHNLGDALVQQKNFDEAMLCFNQAINISPNTASFYYRLSEVWATQGKINQSLACFENFIKLSSNNKHQQKFEKYELNLDEVNCNQITLSYLWDALKYANILAHNQQIEPAINIYAKIVKDSPYQYSEIYNQLGELLLAIGERKKAVVNFELAIFLNSDIAKYHLNLAEALNRWSLSVKSYRTAVKLNPMALKTYYDSLEINDTKDVKVENPIFIVGCGHSGTSVMLALLGSHPSLYPIPYESAIFLKSISKVKETMRNWDEECLADGKRRWIEKTPPHIFQIGKFLKIRPQSQFIIMLRDGRDVVCSLKHRPEYPKFLERIHRWIYDNLAGLLYWNDLRVKVVKYEDLVTNPKATLINIFNFLEEEYDDNVFEFYKTEKLWYSSDIVKPDKIESREDHLKNRNWQINQPLFDGRGRWKQEMTEAEKIIFKKKAQKYLIKFGYVEDENW